MQQFRGKVALVTGAGSGIGRATALQLAAQGAAVVVADASASGAETASGIETQGGRAEFIQADIRDSAAVAGMIDLATGRFGRIDIAVNNAGVDPEVAPEAEWDEMALDQVLSVNVKGLFLCMKYEIEQMLAGDGGAVVNLASAAGLIGIANKPAYTASKHAVVGLTRAAALQYASRGIRINAVCPGAVDTPMLRHNLPKGAKISSVAANHPIGRLASADEIARTILWLCSDQASYVVGHALAVDGGLVVQ
ncbi:MAG: glucose 1-dehydrogenase [Halieaceae bacterium]|nr:glucose 1-dehydrogenase [Halieaceae bacterium]MCP5148270.1 glucose 1-dehydrogenase [Pseudomonadales bacterium]MCP5195073.1 glucose 1-dehydrogenase [Pseudomonadales bacterium]